MTSTSKTILFFGNERLATGFVTSAPTLQMLISEGYNVAAVILNEKPATSRKQRISEVEEIANQNNIPVLKPEKVTDIEEKIKGYKPTIGVLVAYGRIIPESIIELFPYGIINIHPSLLPAHRGSIPIESVILDGSATTGVSLMSLVKAMDAGPIYGQASIDIPPLITKQQLASDLLELGAAMLRELLPEILSGDIIAKPQDENMASYDNLIKKEDGFIEWSNKSSTQILREIRAYAAWPKSSACIGKYKVSITEAIKSDLALSPGEIYIENNRLFIGCQSGSLEILRLIPEGKKEMPIQAFLAGYKV